MKYLVILYLGRDEDQEMSGLVLHLNDPRKNLTPKDILEKFKKDFTIACSEELSSRVCPDCKQIGNDKFCGNCGKALEESKESDPDIIFSFLQDNLFHATVDSVPHQCVDYLESQGWNFWGNHKSQKIVTICGVDSFLLDDWYDEWGTIEKC